MPVSTSSRTRTGRVLLGPVDRAQCQGEPPKLATGRSPRRAASETEVAVWARAEVDLIDPRVSAAHRCAVSGIDAIDVKAPGQHHPETRVGELEGAEFGGHRPFERRAADVRMALSAWPQLEPHPSVARLRRSPGCRSRPTRRRRSHQGGGPIELAERRLERSVAPDHPGQGVEPLFDRGSAVPRRR